MKKCKFFVVVVLVFYSIVLGKSQESIGTVSGIIKIMKSDQALEFAHVVVLNGQDSSFVQGTVSDEKGWFVLKDLVQGDYVLLISAIGFEDKYDAFRIGKLNRFVNLGTIFLTEQALELEDVLITGRRDEVGSGMEKKNYSIAENLSQIGGSVLEAMRNLPGVTVDRDGKLFIRGSDKIIVLMDGKQSALTGFSTQQALDNIPASSIERIEIINNPSSKYDASGMAGIVNIIFKKNQDSGWNGKIGLTTGIGALGIKRENLGNTRDQFRFTPKLNPSASLSYKKRNINWFLNGDVLYHKRLMKNEFIERNYESVAIDQQFIENRNQPVYNLQTGLDFQFGLKNKLTLSGLYNNRAYIDKGDIIYIDRASGNQRRLWTYYEDEVNKTIEGRLTHQYVFTQPGRNLKTSFSYAHRKKDEIFNFENILPDLIGTDTFFLTAAENVFEFNTDYTQAFRKGRIEFGALQRWRVFPNEVGFNQGLNSIMDPTLAGTAEYKEQLTALYGNFIYERKNLELEAGLRVEYAKIDYLVDENHSVYSSDGFDYFGFFPNIRANYSMSSGQNLSVFYSRRVDRPAESSLRSFPTYADPEILRIGNPRLKPQFSNNIELAYKRSYEKGYFYSAVYIRFLESIMTNIISSFPNSTLLTSIDQNAGNGRNQGIEMVISNTLSKKMRIELNGNLYLNTINAFNIEQSYPSNEFLFYAKRDFWSGNLKMNASLKLPGAWSTQLTAIYLAPDILPQGSIGARYSIDMGMKRNILNGKGELFMNATDIFNTMRIITRLDGPGLEYFSTDYYETQTIRVGFQYRF